VYDLKTGQKRTRYGRPYQWESGQTPPCHDCPKIPPDAVPCPAVGRQAELSEQNRRAYQHYQECRAVRKFPKDSRVKRNAGIILMIRESVESSRESSIPVAVANAIGVVFGGGKKK
jgi:hypothetical protein